MTLIRADALAGDTDYPLAFARALQFAAGDDLSRRQFARRAAASHLSTAVGFQASVAE